MRLTERSTTRAMSKPNMKRALNRIQGELEGVIKAAPNRNPEVVDKQGTQACDAVVRAMWLIRELWDE